MAVDQRHPAERDALAGDARRDQLIVGREMEHAGRAQVGELHRLQPEAPVLELVAAVGLHSQERVGGEIGGPHQRRMRRAQQARAADRRHRLAEEADAVARAGASNRPIADRQVDAVAVEVDDRVVRRDPHVDVGMGGDEAGQPRDQPEPREARRRRDDDRLRALAVAKRAGRAIESAQRLDRRGVERGAVLGQGEGAVQAAKERHAEALLEREHLPAHRRLRQRDLGAGAGEAEVARRALEGDQELEWGQLESLAAHGDMHSPHACNG